MASVVEPLGRLTRSGALYESNFRSWIKKIAYQTAGFCLDDSGRPLPWNRYTHSTKINGIGVVDSLRSQISTHLHSRIPTKFPRVRSGRKRRNQLVRYLLHSRMVTQPFRLMDLRVELRYNIFSYAIHLRGEVTWGICMDPLLRRRRLHPITRTCRQLRIESLKPAWSQVNLWIGEFDSYHMLRRQTFASAVHTFIQPFGPTCIQLLRRATLDIRIRRKDVAPPFNSETTSFQLRLRYSPSKGLEIEPWNSKRYALAPASSEKLEAHIKFVSRISETLGIKGLALIIALTFDSNLWCDGALVCEDRVFC